MTSRIWRARRSLALFACIAGIGFAAPVLADNVIAQLRVDPAPLYEEPRPDRKQATMVSTLEKVSALIPITQSRDDWHAIAVEGTLRWVHKDDVVIMRAPGRMPGPAKCLTAAGRTLC
jgi:hypothetical protein